MRNPGPDDYGTEGAPLVPPEARTQSQTGKPQAGEDVPDPASVGSVPHGHVESEDYQHVEVSLPPETLAAMQQPSDGPAAGGRRWDIREGYKVEATDGGVGSVERVFADEGSAEQYMVVKEGLLFKKHVNVPFTAVDRVEDETVYLNIDKEYIRLMEGRDTMHTGDSSARLEL